MASAVQTISADQVTDDTAARSFETIAISDIDEDWAILKSLSTHPLGVRPGGNALTSDRNLALSMGIFGRIPDALLLLLLEYLDQDALLNIGHTCKGLFAFANHDQLWRDLALRHDAFEAKWQGNWKSTFLHRPSHVSPKVDCKHLYSDALYRPFQCIHVQPRVFSLDIPYTNFMPRMHDMTTDEFAKYWSARPFILTKPVRRWRVFQEWDEGKLVAKYGSVKFRAEAVDWTLNNYLEYMQDNKDESPLYLFDRAFVEKMQLEVGKNGDYQPPACFSEDFFTLLGDQRPDHRWLIIGPERSGSTFHKDPNATSAWNAVIRGSKYWIMFPNNITPPGVFVSADQSEVTSPLSIAEWLLTYHEEARQTRGCYEAICGPGEVLHVPSGWWHLVVNLEPAIAITQNFVPRSELKSAISFLKNKPDQVSGFRTTVQDPFALFMQRLEEKHPDLYKEMQPVAAKKRKWAAVVNGQDETQPAHSGFSFGLGNDDLEDE